MKFLPVKLLLEKALCDDEVDHVIGTERCVICNDKGKYNEFWSLCTGCGVWVNFERLGRNDNAK
jgi:sarcosine oxidase delta subunit